MAAATKADNTVDDVQAFVINNLMTMTKRTPRRLTRIEVESIQVASPEQLKKLADWIWSVFDGTFIKPFARWAYQCAFGVVYATAEARAPGIFDDRYHDFINGLNDHIDTPEEDIEYLCAESPLLALAVACRQLYEPQVNDDKSLIQYFFDTATLPNICRFIELYPKLLQSDQSERERSLQMPKAIREYARRQAPEDAGDARSVLELAEQMLCVSLYAKCHVKDLKAFGGLAYITEDEFADFDPETKYSAYGARYAFLDTVGKKRALPQEKSARKRTKA